MPFTHTMCFSLAFHFLRCWSFLHLQGKILGLKEVHRARAAEAMCEQQGSANTTCGNIIFILSCFLLSC